MDNTKLFSLSCLMSNSRTGGGAGLAAELVPGCLWAGLPHCQCARHLHQQQQPRHHQQRRRGRGGHQHQQRQRPADPGHSEHQQQYKHAYILRRSLIPYYSVFNLDFHIIIFYQFSICFFSKSLTLLRTSKVIYSKTFHTRSSTYAFIMNLDSFDTFEILN